MVPVIHRKCGGQTGWYLRDHGTDQDILASADYMRMDGTQPGHEDVFREKCACCGEWITGPWELKRDFSNPKYDSCSVGFEGDQNMAKQGTGMNDEEWLHAALISILVVVLLTAFAVVVR